MLTGELFVIGKDSVTINLLRKKHPEKITVSFKDKCVIIPCNPHHFDDLQWSCSQGHHGDFHLTISWSVSAVREIVWHAYW